MFRRQATTVFKRFNHRLAYTPDAEKAAAFKSFAHHTEEHAASATKLWRNISLGTIPVLAVCAYFVYGTEKHHLSHLAEVSKVPMDQWPNELEYQNMRTKKFFWGDGDKSLFWSWTNHHKTEE